MNDTPLMKAFGDMAKKADRVTVDGGAFCTFQCDDIRGEADNALLMVLWNDGEGQEYRCVITEEAFAPENDPVFTDGVFRVLDSEGELTEIRFYALALLTA